MHRITRTRRRKVVASVISTLLICSAVGFAYYLTTVTFSGENHSTLGTGGSPKTLALAVTVPSGMKPGETVPFTATTSLGGTEVHLEPGAQLTSELTTNPSTCPATWFKLTHTGEATKGFSAYELMHETSGVLTGSKESIMVTGSTPIAGLEISMVNEEGVNQSPCNGAELKVKLTVAGNGH
jgi:hypothetical protein